MNNQKICCDSPTSAKKGAGRILFVLTNVDTIGPNQRKTGYEFSEIAQPSLTFVANDCQVDFASPKGGNLTSPF